MLFSHLLHHLSNSSFSDIKMSEDNDSIVEIHAFQSFQLLKQQEIINRLEREKETLEERIRKLELGSKRELSFFTAKYNLFFRIMQ